MRRGFGARCVHFHAFMQEVQARTEAARRAKVEVLDACRVCEIAAEIRLLCFDEMHKAKLDEVAAKAGEINSEVASLLVTLTASVALAQPEVVGEARLRSRIIWSARVFRLTAFTLKARGSTQRRRPLANAKARRARRLSLLATGSPC